MSYTTANQIQITQEEKNAAYEELENLGFMEPEDIDYINTLDFEANRPMTDFEHINAA